MVQLNPPAHIMEVVRGPLLLTVPSALNWLVSIATAIAGWTMTFLLFSRTRHRIAYWI